MANATATQAYTAIRALEAQMEDTDAAGYHVKVPLKEAVDKIIADNAGVDTYAEGEVGILLAASTATTATELTDGTPIGLYKGNGEVHEPAPGADILFIVNGGTYVTSMSDPA